MRSPSIRLSPNRSVKGFFETSLDQLPEIRKTQANTRALSYLYCNKFDKLFPLWNTLFMANNVAQKNTKWILLTVILMVVFFLGISYFASTPMNNKQQFTTTPTPTLVQSVVPLDEQKQIDQWIKENKLNQYGDPVNTAYAGGTPLFNETTGEYKDRYDYISQQHPDKPWTQ